MPDICPLCEGRTWPRDRDHIAHEYNGRIELYCGAVMAAVWLDEEERA